MAQQDPRAIEVGSNHIVANAIEASMNAVTASSKTVQAMLSEMFDMARESIDHATLTADKFRSTQVMDEIVAIQTDYVKDFFTYATLHTRRFHDLFSGFPAEITKSYQDARLKALNATVVAAQAARQEAGSNIKIYSEAERKPAGTFENREGA